MGFAHDMFECRRKKCEFEDALSDVGFGDFIEIGGDDYDNSIEFYKVGNAARLNDAAQKLVFDAGFSIAFLNHEDGWETHYSWGIGEFKAKRGWRRRYVSDPNVSTTRVIVGSPDNGYYEMNYWPERWGDMETHEGIKSGYYRVVGGE